MAPATTQIYTLSLHDALPIFELAAEQLLVSRDLRLDGVAVSDAVLEALLAELHLFEVTLETARLALGLLRDGVEDRDRKSTRLNSSHVEISYAVFCLKKKNMK